MLLDYVTVCNVVPNKSCCFNVSFNTDKNVVIKTKKTHLLEFTKHHRIEAVSTVSQEIVK